MRLHVMNGILCVKDKAGNIHPVESVEVSDMRMVGPFPSNNPDVSMLVILTDRNGDEQVYLTNPGEKTQPGVISRPKQQAA